ncbi:hypothetical protein HUB98_24090 [Paenibacillus barcinonensis]|uniref:Uncharacterized protein n=1 Tax=Paenibacillus barcinonensis TaxID=198119 RepID=A0ABX6QAG3_PAEBA|nr:hypothetical protein [Paenibacillus barcinonensis]QKS58987.1 hypothetical protein HUB98_24090 [Paenibacillus barcinonensis]
MKLQEEDTLLAFIEATLITVKLSLEQQCPGEDGGYLLYYWMNLFIVSE